MKVNISKKLLIMVDYATYEKMESERKYFGDYIHDNKPGYKPVYTK